MLLFVMNIKMTFSNLRRNGLAALSGLGPRERMICKMAAQQRARCTHAATCLVGKARAAVQRGKERPYTLAMRQTG
jgi:hypothetical protein